MDTPSLSPTLVRAVEVLRCPVCGTDEKGGMSATSRGAKIAALDCPVGHHWDAARQGYVNLLTGAGTRLRADTPEMVDARERFLDAGHYDPTHDAVASAVRGVLGRAPDFVLDVGAGTGHQLAALASDVTTLIGTDLSPAALRRLRARSPEALALVWDTWRTFPIATGSLDAVTCVFAPRNVAEFARVLRPGGALVVVTARPGHLASLREAAGMLDVGASKDGELETSLSAGFELSSRADVDIELNLSAGDAVDAAFMGPTGHHVGRDELARRIETVALGGLFATQAQVSVHAFRRREGT